MAKKDFSVDDILEELGFPGQKPAEQKPGDSLRDFDIDAILGEVKRPEMPGDSDEEASPAETVPAPPEISPADARADAADAGIEQSEKGQTSEGRASQGHASEGQAPSAPASFPAADGGEDDDLRRKRSNEALLESLEKGREERRVIDQFAKRTMVLPTTRDRSANIKLNIDNKILPDTEQLPVDHPLIEEERLRELSSRRKRKISEFVLDPGEEQRDEEDGQEAGPEQDEREIDDYNSYDDTKVIFRDLNQLTGSLLLRFVLLLLLGLAALYITAANDLSFYVPESFRISGNALGYLYVLLALGGVAAIASYTVISNGIVSLVKLKADSDSVCAVAILASLISGLAFSVNNDLVQRHLSYVYIAPAIIGLLFNTVGKLMIVSRTKRNFKFISGDTEKYGADIVEDEEAASAFTRGTMNDFPVLAATHKTEFLTDFLRHSYSPDMADSVSRITVPATLLGSLALGAVSYFLSPEHSIQGALAVFAAVACICSPFCTMLLVNYPLARTSKALPKSASAVLGYSSVDTFHDTNSVLLDAAQLFPEGSIDLIGIKTFANTRIDEAILDAASLVTQTGSILSHMFYDIIAGKTDMLTSVESYGYEDSMGVSGWIGNKRVLIGNRELMNNHSIDLPPVSKEKKYATAGRSILYLSVSGELSAMFIVEMKPNLEVRSYLKEFERDGIYVMLRTVDSIVSINKLAELFEVSPNLFKLLPYRLHEDFAEATCYRPRQSGGLSGNGRFVSFAAALLAAKRIYRSALLGVSLQTASVILGFLLVLIFTVLGSLTQLSPTLMLVYNAAWAALVLIAQRVRKT